MFNFGFYRLIEEKVRLFVIVNITNITIAFIGRDRQREIERKREREEKRAIAIKIF